MRLKDVTLSYDFSKKLIKGAGFDRLTLYFTGRNLLTLTKWTATDPELNEEGRTNSVFPLQKIFVFGLNLNF
jgi:hypothetical protein